MASIGGAAILLALLASLGAQGADTPPVIPRDLAAHAFYYIWYGTPAVDGEWRHWNHEVLPHWTEAVNQQYKEIGTKFQPPDQVHAPFYPLGGPYSSNDPAVLLRHFHDMREAGMRVAVVSWWGPQWRKGTTDGQGVTTDGLLPSVLRAAAEEGVKIAFHLEPYPGRTAATMAEDLQYLMRQHGASPAVLRIAGKPLYYVYDSYHIPPQDWARLLLPEGDLSVRGTQADGIFIGLWLNHADGDTQLLPGGFDGFYTYFSSEAVSYGANPDNWPAMSRWAQQHGKLFIPSVGPGYDDRKIRPWNAAATRDREGGQRYRRWWDAALAADPAAVSITSFNEWGEGTQIEPAAVFAAGQLEQPRYESYGSKAGDEYLYLNITAQYAQQLLEGTGGSNGGTLHYEEL